MNFPYGRAPFWIMVIAIVAGTGSLLISPQRNEVNHDLVMAVFATSHYDTYKKALPEFEKANGVKILLQRVDSRALTNRLQAAMLSGSKIPDMVEVLNGTMGYFTKGPVADVGFLELNNMLDRDGLRTRLVESRFSLWSRGGHIFALPHDVHPVMLAYRKDIVDSLGIDVSKIETWDDFTRIGRGITKDLDGDGNPDRYMLDLDSGGGSLNMLLIQRGGGLFNSKGELVFDNDITVDTIIWYVKQLKGPERMAFNAGWGQPLAKCIADGLVLFYICPDWRSKFFENDVPNVSGKLALMPMPAWEKGGCRTSTWGGTGLAITKQCKKPELAWKLAKFLYTNREDLGKRFAENNIITPLKDCWDLPEYKVPNPYFGGQKIGEMYAALAPDVPPDYVHPYSSLAGTKLNEAYLNIAQYYDSNGEKGIREFARSELKRCADNVRKVIGRNVFMSKNDASSADGKEVR